MTQVTFCRANGLNAVTLSKWLRTRGVKSRACGSAVLTEVEVIPPGLPVTRC